ncbi:MAG: hypothetical protein HRK26_04775 [Rickettsiaceae bacterium H1]|nr:hypothetical protein [Rickettsiaceae bacterium H1]
MLDKIKNLCDPRSCFTARGRAEMNRYVRTHLFGGVLFSVLGISIMLTHDHIAEGLSSKYSHQKEGNDKNYDESKEMVSNIFLGIGAVPTFFGITMLLRAAIATVTYYRGNQSEPDTLNNQVSMERRSASRQII